MKKKQPCSLSEPIYDDVTLELFKQQEVEELVGCPRWRRMTYKIRNRRRTIMAA